MKAAAEVGTAGTATEAGAPIARQDQRRPTAPSLPLLLSQQASRPPHAF
jgi:hypothetical protein